MEKNPSLLYIAFSHIHVSFKMVAQKHAQFQLVVSWHSHVHLCTKHIGLSVLCSSSSQDCLKMSSRKTSLDHLSLNFVCNDVSYCVLYRGTVYVLYCEKLYWCSPTVPEMKVSARRGLAVLDTQNNRKTMLHNKSLVLIATVSSTCISCWSAQE